MSETKLPNRLTVKETVYVFVESSGERIRLKKGKEPLTAVSALVRDKPKKFLKRLGILK